MDEEHCCIPGLVDYYCAWLGECQSDGMGCLCFERGRRLSSERCQYWHSTLNGLNDTLPEGTCPDLVTLFSRDEKEKSKSSASSNDTSLVHAWPYFVIGIVGLMMSLFAALRWNSRNASSEQTARHSVFSYESTATGAGNFEMASPMYSSRPVSSASEPQTGAAAVQQPRRRSSLNPFASDTYEEIDECDAAVPSIHDVSSIIEPEDVEL